jgi:hypothetical protein
MHDEELASSQHDAEAPYGIDEDPRIVEFHRARRVLYDNLRAKLPDNWDLVEIFMQRLHYLIEIIGTRTDDWLNIKQRLALYLPPVIANKRLMTRKRSDLRYFHNDTELAIIAYWAAITGVRPFIKPEKFCYEDTPKKKRHYIVFERNARASAALLERKRLEAEKTAAEQSLKKSKGKKKKKKKKKTRSDGKQRTTKNP